MFVSDRHIEAAAIGYMVEHHKFELVPECHFHDSDFRRVYCEFKEQHKKTGTIEPAAVPGADQWILSETDNFHIPTQWEPIKKALANNFLKKQFEISVPRVMADLENSNGASGEVIGRFLGRMNSIAEDAVIGNRVEVTPWPMEVLSAGQFITEKPEPIEYVIPELLPQGIAGIVSGEGGTSKKSMALLTLCLQMAVAGAQKWLGRFDLVERRSLYLSLEDGRDQVHRRIFAIASHLGLSKATIEENFFILCKEDFFSDGDYSKLVNADGDAQPKLERLKSTIATLKPHLVVIDTRAKCSEVDENDNALNSKLMAVISSLCTIEPMPTVLMVSHVSKGFRSGAESHAMNAVRGAGSLTDDARFILWFKPTNKTDDAGRDLVEIIHAKNSYGPVAPSFIVSFDYPGFELSDVTPESIKAGAKNKDDEELRQKILDTLADFPDGLPFQEIKEKVDNGRDAVREAIKLLSRDQKIEKRGSGKYTRYFLLPSTNDRTQEEDIGGAAF
jgi:hypothetical protein